MGLRRRDRDWWVVAYCFDYLLISWTGVILNWLQAEAAIRSYIETQWALGAFATTELVWENEPEPDFPRYIGVYIEGIYADKGLYGSTGKHASIEAGIVFFHSFVPSGEGKNEAVSAVVTMTQILELKTIENVIDFEGGNPPSPATYGRDDQLMPNPQPGGNYYRVSGSVPFIIRSSL